VPALKPQSSHPLPKIFTALPSRCRSLPATVPKVSMASTRTPPLRAGRTPEPCQDRCNHRGTGDCRENLHTLFPTGLALLSSTAATEWLFTHSDNFPYHFKLDDVKDFIAPSRVALHGTRIGGVPLVEMSPQAVDAPLRPRGSQGIPLQASGSFMAGHLRPCISCGISE